MLESFFRPGRSARSEPPLNLDVAGVASVGGGSTTGTSVLPELLCWSPRLRTSVGPAALGGQTPGTLVLARELARQLAGVSHVTAALASTAPGLVGDVRNGSHTFLFLDGSFGMFGRRGAEAEGLEKRLSSARREGWQSASPCPAIPEVDIPFGPGPVAGGIFVSDPRRHGFERTHLAQWMRPNILAPASSPSATRRSKSIQHGHGTCVYWYIGHQGSFVHEMTSSQTRRAVIALGQCHRLCGSQCAAFP